MFNGFFAPYAYLGGIIFLVVIIFAFILAWIFNRVFKNKLAFPIIMLIVSAIFYFLDVKFLSFIFLIIFGIISITMIFINIFKKIKNKNEKK